VYEAFNQAFMAIAMRLLDAAPLGGASTRSSLRAAVEARESARTALALVRAGMAVQAPPWPGPCRAWWSDDARGLLGACLGHGPADNSRHERTVPDTLTLLFTLGNMRCQRFPVDWFFPDTEEVRFKPCRAYHTTPQVRPSVRAYFP
jgi:hypothetical protein